MFELFVSLLPFILGSALLPIQIIIVILILNSPHQEVLKASAYVGGMTVMRLLLICGKCWVFILSAIGEIAEAELGQTASAIAFLGFVLLAEILLQLPILIKLVLPRQSKNLLAGILVQAYLPCSVWHFLFHYHQISKNILRFPCLREEGLKLAIKAGVVNQPCPGSVLIRLFSSPSGACGPK